MWFVIWGILQSLSIIRKFSQNLSIKVWKNFILDIFLYIKILEK